MPFPCAERVDTICHTGAETQTPLVNGTFANHADAIA